MATSHHPEAGSDTPGRACGRVATAERAIMTSVRDVPIRDETIRLGQALKFAGLAGSGGEARALAAEGGVTVNGEVETRRGRRLRPGDVVATGDDEVRIVAAP
jgi:ribosome-associated protein